MSKEEFEFTFDDIAEMLIKKVVSESNLNEDDLMVSVDRDEGNYFVTGKPKILEQKERVKDSMKAPFHFNCKCRG